jgi:hypothetical protein
MESNVRFYQRHGYRITDLRQFSERIVLAHMSKAASAGDAGPGGQPDAAICGSPRPVRGDP